MHLTHQSDSKSITTKDRRDKATNEGVSLPSRTIVHAKLEMTSPQDAEEIEADDMANAIVSGGKIKRKISHGSTGSSGIAVSSQMEGQLSRLQGGGRQMPAGLQNMMENGFGRDFSQVSLHTDSDAVSMSSSIHAKAFTLGNDIYFNQGQYSPDTSEGQRLLAHELAHVVQGGGKVGREPYGTPTYSSVEDDGRVVHNNLPVECGEISKEAKEKILYFIYNVFKKEIGKWESWRNMENWEDKNVSCNIPPIHSLLAQFDSLKSDVLLCTNSDYKLSIDNSEVWRLFHDNIDNHDLSLLSEWMQYDKNRSNSLQEYLQITPGEEVRHTYKMSTEFNANIGVGIGAGGKVDTPLGKAALGCYPQAEAGGGVVTFYYENNLGMKWSISYVQAKGGAGFACEAELRIGPSVSSSFGTDGLCVGEAINHDTWYGPQDFNGFIVSVKGGGEAGAGVYGGAELSGFRIFIFDKDDLVFNTSGVCLTGAIGLGGGVFVTGDIGGQFEISDITKAPNKLGNPNITEMIPQLSDTTEFMIQGSVYFDSGSTDLGKGDFSDENNRIIGVIVNNMIYNYNSDLIDKLIVYTIGHSSPIWRDAKTKEEAASKNMKLAQERIDNTNMFIEEQMNRISGKDKSIDVDFVGQCIEDSISNDVDYSIDNHGSEEGLRETNDLNNNDWRYRRVDIYVYVRRKADNRIMHV